MREECGQEGDECSLATLAGYDIMLRADGTKDPDGRRSDATPGPLAAELRDAYHGMAADQNGTPFAGEIEAALDRLGADDDDTREAVRGAWRVYGSVLAHERERLMPEIEDKK